MAKTKVYRTREERRANNAKLTKGAPMEIYQLQDDGLLRLAVSQNEACRDMNDVEAVLLERDITGTFIPMRRVGEPIGRFEQTVTSFVTPKSDPIYKEWVQDAVKSEEQPQHEADAEVEEAEVKQEETTEEV